MPRRERESGKILIRVVTFKRVFKKSRAPGLKTPFSSLNLVTLWGCEQPSVRTQSRAGQWPNQITFQSHFSFFSHVSTCELHDPRSWRGTPRSRYCVNKPLLLLFSLRGGSQAFATLPRACSQQRYPQSQPGTTEHTHLISCDEINFKGRR